MSEIYEEIYVRNLKVSQSPKEKDYVVGETETGTKLFPVQSLKNLFYSAQCYDTLEKMKLSEFEEGDICYTSGYRMANDGGGAMYTIVYEPTTVQDGGLTHDLYTSNTLRARMLMSDNRVNVHQFGAYGDGSKDDTKAIQNAINTGLQVDFTCGKTYKVTSPIVLNNSNQVINFNNATIVPYNCYAISIQGEEDSSTQNVKINDLIIRCSNDGNGIQTTSYTKNISLNNFRINGIHTNNKGLMIDSCEMFDANHGYINGQEYNGCAIQLTSNDSENRKRKITLNDIQVENMDAFCKISYTDETTSVVVNDCKFVNDDLTESNLSSAFYIINTLRSVLIHNFSCINADYFLYTSSEVNGDIIVDDLYIYDNRKIYNLNSIAGGNKVILKGNHTYKGTNVHPKYVIIENMLSNLYNYACITYEPDITYSAINIDGIITGTLYDNHIPEMEEEMEVNSEISKDLVIDKLCNARFNWTGALVLKNIVGFEGQIILVRSTTSQEISSGGNIVLYPEEPSKTFKEAMSSTPYKFKCQSGKWVKIG